MSATTPSGDLELQPGAGPVNLPITVRNDGGSPSDPVQVALNLPPGVSAVPAGGGGGAVSGFSRQADTPATTQLSIDCPGGTGTVTCKTGSGLQPGQTAVLTFRLQADDSAQGGTVTGSVTAGATIKVAVSVKVTVKSPPDLLALQADTDGLSAFPWTRNPLVYVRVRNTGDTTKPVTVTFDHALYQSWSLSGFPCHSTDTGATCTTRGALAPGQHVNLWVRLKGRPAHNAAVTVNATLGKAAQQAKVSFGCWLGICDVPYPTTGVPPTPTSSPSSSTTTSDTPESASSSKKPPHRKPTPSSTPPAKPTDPVTTTPPSTPSTTTSAPPTPGSGNSGKPGETPPSIEPRGFFDWLRG